MSRGGENEMFVRIKEIRERKNISQDDLAKISGVGRTTISALETGKAVVTTNITMQKIATALGESVATVFFAEQV